MVWDFAEANPFSGASGSFLSLLNQTALALSKLPQAPRPAFAAQADAQALRRDAPIMLATDPPYYDNVGYADLSDFFYVWLRHNLRAVYPELFRAMLA
ncbi:MAG: hypothetical protein CUN48_19910, partial [Candidatus Thermofonsia Clade 3 bacterium]